MVSTAACAADRESRPDVAPMVSQAPPRYQARVGIPILMDIPVFGFLFGRTTTSR